MGGKALKIYGIITERKNTIDFLRIANEIRDKINLDFHGKLETSVVQCYHEKSDHGDLDLLLKITSDCCNVNFREYIANSFKPKAIHKNSSVYSFDYKNFQIDFILIAESRWDTAQTYFSYDPIGNIMGKTYHKFGLSYGWDGLFYKFRNFNGVNSQNILLTTNAKEIFNFGGYDYDRYLNGFDTLEEIFEFCINSKYFDSEMFKLENLSSIDRKRNKKRGSYNSFLNHINENNITTTFQFEVNKDLYLPMIDERFPDVKFLEKLEKLRKKDVLNKQLASKFNGNIIMEKYSDLTGKKLGSAITKFKKSLGDNHDEFILNNNIKTIFNKFEKINDLRG